MDESHRLTKERFYKIRNKLTGKFYCPNKHRYRRQPDSNWSDEGKIYSKEGRAKQVVSMEKLKDCEIVVYTVIEEGYIDCEGL